MATAALTILGIVLPAAALTWSVRRFYATVPLGIVAFLLFLTFVFIGPTLVTSDMPVPLDEVMRGYPYHGVVGEVHPINPLTNDTVKQILPWMDAVRREFRHGRAPLWNPWAFSGYSLLGNGQSAPFAPAFLLTLFVPLPKQLIAMAGLKLFVALLFTYLLVKRDGAGNAAAMTAAVLFAYCVFQNVYLYYPLTTVTSLLPAMIFAVRFSRDDGRYRGVVLVALIAAALLAGGHPESVVHTALAVAAVLAIERVPRAALLRIAIGMLLGLLLAAPAWMPVAQQIAESSRAAEIDAGRGMTPPFPLATARVLLSADAFGNPARGTWHGPLNYSMVAPTYLGLLPLVCIPIALLRAGGRVRALAIVAMLYFLVAMNSTPLAHAINAIPPLSLMANDRLRVVVVFFAALVTANVVDRFGRFAWLALIVAIVDLLHVNAVFNAPAPARFFKPSIPILTRLQSLQTNDPYRILGRDWVFLQNASVDYELEDVRGTDPMAPRRYLDFLQLVAVDDPSSDVKRIDNPNQPGVDFLGVRYLLTEPDVDAGGRWIERYRGPDGRLYENSAALPRFFAPAIAEPFDRGRPLLEQLRGISDFRDRVIAELPAPFANPVSCTPQVHTIKRRPTKLTVTIDSCAAVFIASSQSAATGWTVRIDGKRLSTVIVNGAFLGFIAPAGRHVAIVEYQPRVWRLALLLSALGLVALIAGRGKFT